MTNFLLTMSSYGGTKCQCCSTLPDKRILKPFLVEKFIVATYRVRKVLRGTALSGYV